MLRPPIPSARELQCLLRLVEEGEEQQQAPVRPLDSPRRWGRSPTPLEARRLVNRRRRLQEGLPEVLSDNRLKPQRLANRQRWEQSQIHSERQHLGSLLVPPKAAHSGSLRRVKEVLLDSPHKVKEVLLDSPRRIKAAPLGSPRKIREVHLASHPRLRAVLLDKQVRWAQSRTPLHPDHREQVLSQLQQTRLGAAASRRRIHLLRIRRSQAPSPQPQITTRRALSGNRHSRSPTRSHPIHNRQRIHSARTRVRTMHSPRRRNQEAIRCKGLPWLVTRTQHKARRLHRQDRTVVVVPLGNRARTLSPKQLLRTKGQ